MKLKLLNGHTLTYPGDNMEDCIEVLARIPSDARDPVRGLYFEDARALNSANTRLIFELFPFLDSLTIRDKKLVEFDFTALSPRLAWLSITCCGLKELHRRDLAHLTQLEELNLSANCLTYIDPRALEQLPSLVNIHLEDQFGPTPLSFELYDELHYNAQAIKADVRALFGPHACRAAVIALLCIQRKRLPAECRIHKDVLRYMVGPMLLDTGYDAEWRRERVDAGARVPVKKIKR